MNTQHLVGCFPELPGDPSSLSFGVALVGGVEPVVEEAGGQGWAEFWEKASKHCPVLLHEERSLPTVSLGPIP